MKSIVETPVETTFVGRKAAAKLAGLSSDQFDRAIALLGLAPIEFSGTNIRVHFWLRSAIVENIENLRALTGRPKKINMRPFRKQRSKLIYAD